MKKVIKIIKDFILINDESKDDNSMNVMDLEAIEAENEFYRNYLY